MEFGVLVYDVPLTQRSLYNRLRKKIRKYGIPMTWSVYLIPWGERSMIQSILDGIESDRPNVVSSKIIKFDPAEEKKLERAASDGLNLIIRNAKELMMKRLQKAEENQNRILEQLEESKRTKTVAEDAIEQAKAEVKNQYRFEHKKAVRHAEDTLLDAKRLALIFNLSDQLEVGLAAMETMVRHKWTLIGINTDAPEEVKA
jgi:hypothetical protein